MSTVGKAISLLDLFSATEAELGLSELARRAGFDKATTRRLLVALAESGFIEQDPVTRDYRLGAGLSRLARIRESQFPLLQTAVPFIRELAQQTCETVHLSEYSAGSLVTVHVELSSRANRVNVDIGQVLPLHSTASGIAFLSKARPEAVEEISDETMPAFTSHTITARGDLMEAVNAARSRGYSLGDQGYEDGVFSVGAPILGADGYAIATLAVASPSPRMNADTASTYGEWVVAATQGISARLNGAPVDHAVKLRA